MKTRIPCRLKRGNRRGAALVIALSLVVLLTIVVVAFLSRSVRETQISESRGEQVKVDSLARSAVDYLLFDLRQEIAAGSKPDGTPAGAVYTQESKRIFVPRHGATVVPAKVGISAAAVPDDVANVLKLSSSAEPFYQGANYDISALPPPDHASNLGTGTRRGSARYLDAADWNKPLLLPSARLSTVAGELVPGVKLPDWIFVTDSGRAKITAPTPGVMGRYAYIVYDQGGLIDATVAGFPSGLPGRESARKGLIALADLSRLPGVMKSGEIVDWRNRLTGDQTGFGTSNFPESSAHGYLKFILDPSLNRGFTQVYPGDDTFLSRTELIEFQKANPALLAAESLRYLGTFTRGVNSPTWSPTTPEPLAPGDPASTFDYAAEAERSTWANRNVANLRWPADRTIRRPAAGGTFETVVVKKGDPILQRRFPLHKIKLLEDPIGNAAQIAYYFGLRWEETPEPRWEYLYARNQVGTDYNGTGRKYIRTIEQVASQSGNDVPGTAADGGNYPREPNFFEILRAGILHGSMDYNRIYTIGACIIDQYDTDNIPTHLRLGHGAPDNRKFWGMENLPYLSEILFWPYRPTDDPTRLTYKAWIVPELWNPHRNASSLPTDVTEFRVLVEAASSRNNSGPLYSTINGGPAGVNGAPPAWATLPGLYALATQDDAGKPAIEFTNSTDFAEPTIMTPAHVRATPNNNSATEGQRTGFYLGQAVVPDRAVAIAAGIPPLSGWQDRNVASLGQGSITLAMQYRRNGAWHTYMESIANFTDPTFWATHAQKGADNVDGRPGFTVESYLARRSYGPLDPRSAAEFHGDLKTSMWRPSPGKSWRPIAGPDAGYPRINVAGGIDPDPDYDPAGLNDKVSQNGIEYTPHVVENLGGGKYHAADIYSMALVNAATLRGDEMVRPGDAFRPGVFPMASGRIEDRPIILNRPFRSVAELGYAFRAREWRTLDMSSPVSPDAGLLDLFSLGEEKVIAGVFNPNTRNPRTLEAMLNGALLNDLDTSGTPVISTDEAASIAEAIVAETTSNPITNRAEIASRLAALPAITYARKHEREAVTRALAEAAEPRVWNLLVDVVVQTGRYSPNATQLADFRVQGERRYWLHLAIDRWTGKLIDKQTEVVYE